MDHPDQSRLLERVISLTRRSRYCPACNTRGIPVIYGMPSSDLHQAVEQGLIALGGCIVRGDEDSTWWCPDCEESFAGPDRRRAEGESPHPLHQTVASG